MIELRVVDRRFLRACSAGLDEKTAVVELSADGCAGLDPLLDRCFRDRVLTLNPGEPLHGVSDWPGDFLVSQGHHDGRDDSGLWWLGQWVVALTVAIQRWGRDPVWRGRVCEVGPGRLRLAIPYAGAEFFDEALSLAVRLIAEWSAPEGSVPESGAPWLGWLKAGSAGQRTLDGYFGGRLAEIQEQGLAPMTVRFLEAAARRRMPFEVLHNYVQIGWGAHALRLNWALSGQTSWLAMGIAKNKVKTGLTLGAAGIPTPRAAQVNDAEAALRVAQEFGWPVVVKPGNRDGGVGVQVGIVDQDRLVRAFESAQRINPDNVIVEEHCPGEDHRMLVVRGTVLQVVRRHPPQVLGDGVRSVRELLQQLNDDPRRGTHEWSLLKVVTLDAEALEYLAEQGLTPDSVPAVGQSVRLARIANISTGGTAEDVTAVAHPDNVALVARAVRMVGLDIAGVDFLCPDISRSWHQVGGTVCEVNGQPGFRPHWLADPDRDIHGEVLDLLLEGRPARIPTAAITGTNGKTTTAEMLYRIWMAAGKVTGVCTTERVLIGDEVVSTENLSGQPGARIILNDPAVQAAVLEMPRLGLILFGHQCDRYDVAALLNVQHDHLGVDGVETLEQMAELKAEVLQRATGAIVVNAEDPLCLAMRARAGTDRHILVARSPDVEAVIEHRCHGGEAVFLADRDSRPWIILAAGASETALMPVHDIPATMGGLLTFNETNALFAAALAWAQGVHDDTIHRALSMFDNSPDHNPGRFNFFEGLPFEIMLDYAHNPEGVRGLCSVTAARPVSGRRVLCSLNIGNRYPLYVEMLAPLLASTFDEFVVGCDPVLIARFGAYEGDEPCGVMVARYLALLVENGVDPDRIVCEVDRITAIRAAFERARPGDLVVVLGDLDETRQVVDEWLTAGEGAEVRNR